ncbi:TMEM165/GDT1 family protein [Shewanella surugensis]|uniref:GDT1 family protein n=1 Tax=Shewanella surugensis TaxID=212020 RepID=A0ABT0L8Q3_9GAMM|nr:TMEM165/GDT1 family protein [Shewanella surugensis]MCL1124081.1 TMEM165/GDT1 family protein [Shewanella surugensis]
MEALITSTISVAIAEIGDKTQLLALILAARFKNKTAIILGMLLATLLNHFAAAWLGEWLMSYVTPITVRYWVAGALFSLALWILIPDKVDAKESRFYVLGPFLATFSLFFLAEIGDKTQIATMVLAAKYNDLTLVVAGSTLGMMIANVPVIFLAQFSADKLPMLWIHRICAVLFVIQGIATLLWP